jgi:diguanylate cyclase (GGDEF)-like protein
LEDLYGLAQRTAAVLPLHWAVFSTRPAVDSASNEVLQVTARWVRSHRLGVLAAAGILAAATAASLFTAGRGGLAAGAALGAVFAWTYCCRHGRMLLHAAQRGQQLADLHLSTIEALALAIDAKDKTAASHIRRVQYYAEALARSVGASDDEVRGVTTAALLHDVGKLAIPEHILSKPGPLSEDEFEKIRIHPQVGFQIIEHVAFPFPVAPLVLCHHERWDGKGYPLGLRGADIPLGARILAVADYFDSVTRDRPYHKRVAREIATVLLRQEAGRALDPDLVGRFLDLLPALGDVESEGQPAAFALPGDRALHSSGVGGERSAYENIAHAHQEIYALYEIAQAIGSTLDVADTMSLIAGKLSPLVPFACCALFVGDEDQMLRCRFATGVDADDIRGMTLPPGHGLAGWVVHNRRSLASGRPATDFGHDDRAGIAPHLYSALASPLIAGDCVIGALVVYHTEPGFYDDEHRRLLDRVAEQAAAAVSNSIVFEQTRQASLSDPLTGLPNSRFMLGYLGRELSRADRLDRPVSILVLDMDDFKEINDTYGHHVGDRALRAVARSLRDTIRPYDICVRYAGDEFIIVLPDCGRDEAEAKRVELQRAIDGLAFEAAPGQPVRLRLSIGAAVFPEDGSSYEALLAAADGRMYLDKRHRKTSDSPNSPADSLFPPLGGGLPIARIN